MTNGNPTPSTSAPTCAGPGVRGAAADPARLQRGVPAAAPDGRAAPGRGSHPRRRGAAGPAARAEPPRLPPHERRDGHVAAGHERGVRALLRRAAGGGRRALRVPSAHGRRLLHLRRAAPLRGRGLRPGQRRGRAQGRVEAGAARAPAGIAAAESEAGRRPGHARRSLVGEHGQGGVPRQRDGHRADLDAARALSAGGGGAAEGDDPHPRRDQPRHPVAPDAGPRAHHAAARPGRPRLHGPAGGHAEGGRVEGLHRRRAQGLRPRLVRGRREDRLPDARARAQARRQARLPAQGAAAGPRRRLQPPARPDQGRARLPRPRLPAYHAGLLTVPRARPPTCRGPPSSAR